MPVDTAGAAMSHGVRLQIGGTADCRVDDEGGGITNGANGITNVPAGVARVPG
jgi:hypothetical protein